MASMFVVVLNDELIHIPVRVSPTLRKRSPLGECRKHSLLARTRWVHPTEAHNEKDRHFARPFRW